MWRTIGLIGRDNQLKKDIRPRLNNNKPFVLQGKRGTGKTALLEWCYDYTKEKKAITSAGKTVRECLLDICQQWKLEICNEDGKPQPKSKWKTAWMERAIYASRGYKLFLDDLDRATPALLRRLKPMRDRHILVGAASPPLKKEDAKRLVWGISKIDVKPLQKPDALRLADLIVGHLASPESPHDLANIAQGCPGRIVAAVKGEIEKETLRTDGEEIDISPIFLLGIACLMIVRYAAIGLDSTSLYLLGGVGMGLAVFARFLLFRGMS